MSNVSSPNNYDKSKNKFILLNKLTMCLKEFDNYEKKLCKIDEYKNNLECFISIFIIKSENDINIYKSYVNEYIKILEEIKEIKNIFINLLITEQQIRTEIMNINYEN
jgi:hypothetical protein